MRSDADLLRGDARAFTAFFRRHDDAVLGYFLRRPRQADLAAAARARPRRRTAVGMAVIPAGTCLQWAACGPACWASSGATAASMTTGASTRSRPTPTRGRPAAARRATARPT